MIYSQVPAGWEKASSSLLDSTRNQIFRIALSIEKDTCAYDTLKLRSFFRQFPRDAAPDEYYEHLRGKLTREDLYSRYAEQTNSAEGEAWNAELGNYRAFSAAKIGQRIERSLGGAKNWVLIGGPPCQAYSIAGRSRILPVDRRDGTQNYEKDKRNFLYKAYLRILAEHRPPIFVMENVKGILSAKIGGKRTIDRILSDLRHPVPAVRVK